MSNIPCVYDEDCPSTLVCYSNITWFNSTAENKGCGCSTWHGFTGYPNCLNYFETETSLFWLVSCIIIAIVTLVFCLWTFFNLTILKKYGMLKLDVLSLVHMQLFFGFLSIGISQALGIAETVKPSLYLEIPYPKSEKYMITHLPREILFVLGALNGVLAGVTIGLVFIDIAEKARTMSTMNQTTIPKVRKFLLIFQAGIAFAMILCCALSYARIAVVFGMIVAVCVTVVYIVGFVKINIEMQKLISSSTHQQNENANSANEAKSAYSKVIREIRDSTLFIAFFNIGVIISGMIVLTKGSYWKDSDPATIPPSVVGWQVIVMM